jgi:hypothetical protein
MRKALAVWLTAVLGLPASVFAASVTLMLTDQAGAPVDDAVIYVTTIDGEPAIHTADSRSRPVQRDVRPARARNHGGLAGQLPEF